MSRVRRPGHANLSLGPGPEFDRIRKIVSRLPARRGVGDDCSLLEHGGEFIALSTDVSVQDVHFRLDWISPEEVGWRAAAAALSDLAAEGAEPIGLLCAVSTPASAPENELLELMSGVSAAAAAVGAEVLGGDLSAGPVWSLCVTVVGRTDSPVTRGGAKPGDSLWVTGALGGARAAIEAWQQGREPLAAARNRFARPEPRIAAGRWLARHGARAMIDLSDGLAGDAWHLAAASELSVAIELDDLPITTEAAQEAKRLGVTAQQFAAESGEDYELLLALPMSFAGADLFMKECGIGLTRIGAATEGSGARFLFSGKPIDLRGFNHFR